MSSKTKEIKMVLVGTLFNAKTYQFSNEDGSYYELSGSDMAYIEAHLNSDKTLVKCLLKHPDNSFRVVNINPNSGHKIGDNLRGYEIVQVGNLSIIE